MGCLCTFLLALNLMQTILEGTKLARPPSRRLALKDVVDLFKRFSSRLGVEEEDVDGHDRAERSENHVRFPFYDILVSNWQQDRSRDQ